MLVRIRLHIPSPAPPYSTRTGPLSLLFPLLEIEPPPPRVGWLTPSRPPWDTPSDIHNDHAGFSRRLCRHHQPHRRTPTITDHHDGRPASNGSSFLTIIPHTPPTHASAASVARGRGPRRRGSRVHHPTGRTSRLGAPRRPPIPRPDLRQARAGRRRKA